MTLLPILGEMPIMSETSIWARRFCPCYGKPTVQAIGLDRHFRMRCTATMVIARSSEKEHGLSEIGGAD